MCADLRASAEKEHRNLSLKGRLAGSLQERPHLLPLVTIVVLFSIGALVSPGFASISNIRGVLSLASLIAFASAGQTLIIISGGEGIDLSVGSVMTLAALVATGLLRNSDAQLPWALLAVALTGVGIGLVNFLGINVVGLNPLIMTLGMSYVVAGGGLVYSQTHGPSSPGSILLEVGGGRIGPVPWMAVIGIIITAVIQFLLRRTRFGQQLYLCGANRKAAILSGVPIRRVLVTTYMLGSLLAGLAGVLLLSYAGSANLSIGEPYTLLSVASVVIGGTALTGGKGDFVGTALGAVVFTVLLNFLTAVGLSPAVREVLTGIALLIVLSFTVREAGVRT